MTDTAAAREAITRGDPDRVRALLTKHPEWIQASLVRHAVHEATGQCAIPAQEVEPGVRQAVQVVLELGPTPAGATKPAGRRCTRPPWRGTPS